MLRRFSWLLVFVSMCFFISGICIAQDEDFPNLVLNFDFEDPIDAPWTMWVEGTAGVTKSIDDEVSFTGDQSLLIDVFMKGAGQRIELHQNNFVLKMGDRLTYAMWAKVDEGDARDAKMVCNHRADPWTTYGSQAITITDEWTEFHTDVNITADDDIAGIYVELNDSVEGMIWFDRFRFYEGDYEEEDLEEAPKIAVNPQDKLATTWAGVKSAR